jgi:hypothetical protein
VIVVEEGCHDASLVSSREKNESGGIQLSEDGGVGVVVGVIDVDRHPKHTGRGIRGEYGVVENPTAVRIAATVKTGGGDDGNYCVVTSCRSNHRAVYSGVVVVDFAAGKYKCTGVYGKLSGVGGNAAQYGENHRSRVNHTEQQHITNASMHSNCILKINYAREENCGGGGATLARMGRYCTVRDTHAPSFFSGSRRASFFECLNQESVIKNDNVPLLIDLRKSRD